MRSIFAHCRRNLFQLGAPLAIALGAGATPGAVTAIGEGTNAPAAKLEWNARNVEHLYNRAGFGARPEEIAEGVRIGPEALIEKLLTPTRPWVDTEPFLVHWEDFDLGPDQIPLKQSKYKTAEEASKSTRSLRLKDRTQFVTYSDQWFASMIDHADPLRDRMTLFWHGLFTTSLDVVKRKFEMMKQHQWLRREALSSVGGLLHGLVADPAMLQYLDNNTNVKGHPNENFARELMELYSLGEGHYTEVDVREAARALTGCTGNPDGLYEFRADRHDDGEKTILGEKGRFTSKELVDILLRQPACAQYISRKLLTWMEGVEPSKARLDTYASYLREQKYELKPFLKKLFLDPEFYRAEVVGNRVQGPIEFLVGFCRKLELAPPPQFLYTASTLLGQGFYQPPTVKGWDEGLGWVTGDALMQRGNAAAVLLGVLDIAGDPAPPASGDNTSMAMAEGGSDDPAMVFGYTAVKLRRLTWKSQWNPSVELAPVFAKAKAKTDAEVVAVALDRWLAIEPPAATKALLADYLRAERKAWNIPEGGLSESGEGSEIALRRLARMVFSLPEAQLE